MNSTIIDTFINTTTSTTENVNDGIINLFTHLSYSQTALLALFLCWAVSPVLRERPKRVENAPVFGFRSIFEPTFLLKARFIFGGHKIIADGYKQVGTSNDILLVLF
jgi:hypothetical protein